MCAGVRIHQTLSPMFESKANRSTQRHMLDNPPPPPDPTHPLARYFSALPLAPQNTYSESVTYTNRKYGSQGAS